MKITIKFRIPFLVLASKIDEKVKEIGTLLVINKVHEIGDDQCYLYFLKQGNKHACYTYFWCKKYYGTQYYIDLKGNLIKKPDGTWVGVNPDHLVEWSEKGEQPFVPCTYCKHLNDHLLFKCDLSEGKCAWYENLGKKDFYVNI